MAYLHVNPTPKPILLSPSLGPNSSYISPAPSFLNRSHPGSLFNLAMPCFSMTLGCISNILALTILFKSYSRFRRRSKATFFLLAGALLLTDLSGHIILGAFALRLYLSILWKDYADHSEVFCQVFGACMVFFGLCPLFLGSAMAVERCVGVTRPLLHSTTITATHAKLAVALLFSLSILLATLPLTQVGSYVRQFPDTWCFLQIHDGLSKANQGLTLAFTSLGLASLGLSLLCNCLSGMALLQARLRGRSKAKSKPKTPGVPQRKSAPSHDVEMMLQLAGITLVSFICWTPFLICISLSVSMSWGSSGYDVQQYKRLVFIGLRLASWNQILDPWVYILLRRAVLRRLYGVMQPHRQLTQSSFRTMDREPQSFSRH